MFKRLLARRVAQIEQRVWSQVTLDPKDKRVDYIYASVADSLGVDEHLPCVVFLSETFLMWSYQGPMGSLGGAGVPLAFVEAVERTGAKTFNVRAVLPDGDKQVASVAAATHVPPAMVDRFVGNLTRLQAVWRERVAAGQVKPLGGES